MKALLLDGSDGFDPPPHPLREFIEEELQRAGWPVETLALQEHEITPCCGNFNCWVRTPGRCMTSGLTQEVAGQAIASDLLIFLTPVVFGGYSAELKKAVDHLIPNISPFFATVSGETHHKRRYSRYPGLAMIGYLSQPDAESEAIFHALAKRNALNFYPLQHTCLTVNGSLPAEEVRRQIKDSLARSGGVL